MIIFKIGATLTNKGIVVRKCNIGDMQETPKSYRKKGTIITKDKVMKILRQLSSPYGEIASHGKRPKLAKSDINRLFAKQLERYEIVSSIKELKNGIQINTFQSP